MQHHSWYTDKSNIQSPDTIHQVLVFGTLDEVKALRETVGEKKLKDLFLHYPKKLYTASGLNFIKKFILHINSSIDEQKYLKYTPRHIR